MSNSFTEAAASYFGLPPGTTSEVSTESGWMYAQFTVCLSNEQIQGIVKRMTEMPTPADAPEPAFTALPTLQEVMAAPERFVGVAGCEGLLAKACRLSLDVRERVDAKEWEMAGEHDRQVEHGPEAEPEDIPSPPLVWLPKGACTAEQLACPVGVDDVRGRIAVYEDQLTDVQRMSLDCCPATKPRPVIPSPPRCGCRRWNARPNSWRAL